MTDRISAAELNRTTLARQSLLARADESVETVVGRVGGLQAQHADMPYIALWSRREGQSVAALESALTGRSLVKATVMRSTLHLVPAADWPALDAVSAEQRLAAWRPSARRAGVDLEELNARVREFCAEPRSVDDVEELAAGMYPGVDAAAAIPGGVTRAWWRLASAGGGLVHVPPSGLWGSHAPARYVAGSVWLTDAAAGAPPDPDEARALAVERYLTAFGPAAAEDIARGVGLRGASPLKRALARLDTRRLDGPDGQELVDLADADVVGGDTPAPVRFLPRWDHLLVAYKGRDRLIDAEHVPAVYRRNGDVLPTFWVDGRVAGTWQTTSGESAATLRLTPTNATPSPSVRDEIEAEGRRLLDFLATAVDAGTDRGSADDRYENVVDWS